MSFHCRNKKQGCQNRYDEIIGAAGWGGTGPGGDCLPCYYAGLMRQVNQTPDTVEAAPQLIGELMPSLAKMGWTWGHVRQSYALGVTLL